MTLYIKIHISPVCVQVWESPLDALSGLLGVVVRDLGAQVVRHVGAPDVVLFVQKKSTEKESKVSILPPPTPTHTRLPHPSYLQDVHDLVVGPVYREEGPADPIPLLPLQVGDVHVGVVEQRDDTEPSVHDCPGAAVHSSHGGKGRALGPVGERGDDADDSGSGGDDLGAAVVAVLAHLDHHQTHLLQYQKYNFYNQDLS